MAAATLTAKGQIVIPADIRARYDLTPGTQVEFVDDDGVIRLLVRRRIAPSDPGTGYGMIKVKTRKKAAGNRLSDFDSATLLRKARGAR